jgi:hypothetical protein
MTSNVHVTPELREQVDRVVREYLTVRSQGPWPLSTARAIDFVRKKVGVRELDDRTLSTLIAEIAVANNLNVSFDGVLQ